MLWDSADWRGYGCDEEMGRRQHQRKLRKRRRREEEGLRWDYLI